MELIKRTKIRIRTKTFFIPLFGLIILASFYAPPARAQQYEVQQLLLDVEKLAQFKSILSDMQQGYSVLTEGYDQVKNLSQGNFGLHQVFLDGLLSVNPEIKKYQRVADIIAGEASILSEYKSAFNRFKRSGSFSFKELDYLATVYSRLTSGALENLNDLATVITASKMRMSDNERLSAIDGIYNDTSDKLQFLRSFNRKTSILQLQRAKEQDEVQTLQKIYQP